MPISDSRGKKNIINWVKNKRLNIKKVLDVGCGCGTYPDLLKETNKLLNDSEWIGVEAWETYIGEYNLHSKYNKIYNEDIRIFDWSKETNIDLVIFGDVLEHMKKEEAQAAVEKALQNSKYVVISIPIKYMAQGAEHGNPFEIHVKPDWSHEEVLESFPNIVNNMPVKKIGVYWLES